MPILDLIVPPSPSSSSNKWSLSIDSEHIGLVPIELKNGCSEEDCSIESDDPYLTNMVRRHFLEHFGHRDLHAMVQDYAPDAILIQVVNGVRKSYRGRSEIQMALEEIFHLHPTVNSTFELQHVMIHDKNAMTIWKAKTPTHIFPQSCDTFLYNQDGKIVKQFFNCQMHDLEHPWYIQDE